MTSSDQALRMADRERVHLGLAARADIEARLACDRGSPWLLVKVGGLLEANLKHGWEGGNEFIEAIAERLHNLTGAADLTGHLGGNEFAVVLDDRSRRAAEDLRSRALPLLAEPVQIAAGWVDARPVITIAPASGDAADPWTVALTEHHYQSAQRTRDQVRSVLSAARTLKELATIAAEAGVALGFAAARITLADISVVAGSPAGGPLRAIVIGPPDEPVGAATWWNHVGQHNEIPDSSLRIVGDELAVAAKRVLAMDEADVDPLTGLLNRRGLTRATLALTPPYAVAFVELDDMKRLNDTCGHKTGDLALCCLAKALRAGRDHDIAARWGGDEFVVVLPGATAAEAAGRLQRLLRQLQRDTRFGTTGISFSGGVAAGRGNLALEIDTADERMYQAKRAGKGRVVADGTPGAPVVHESRF